jgi:hypothetical protein
VVAVAAEKRGREKERERERGSARIFDLKWKEEGREAMMMPMRYCCGEGAWSPASIVAQVLRTPYYMYVYIHAGTYA